MKKWISVAIFFYCGNIIFAQKKSEGDLIQIIFTSDAHYGISRKEFRGDTNVQAQVVNRAMIESINSLPGTRLPYDKGVDAGNKMDAVDYVVEGGDIANRMEPPVQSAAISWNQFDFDYIKGIHLKNYQGQPTQLLIIPGNHDISNAIGFYKTMNPRIDRTSMVQIYNLMMQPQVPKTNDTYNYNTDRINYSKDMGGIHFLFITLWPDSLERIWMDHDLDKISPRTPVIIFTHDEPICEAKHFTNPNPGYTINGRDRFENLLAEQYKDSTEAKKDNGSTILEQNGWVAFLKRHPNIKAYFHGNNNYNQFYVYRGPDNDVSLPVFRVDSPMKGKYSKNGEKKLSFLVISINTRSKMMTVRQCFWNKDPKNPGNPVQWGTSETISLNFSALRLKLLPNG